MKTAGYIVGLTLLLAAAGAHGADRYVSLSGLHQNGFTNWTDAATNVQDAVNAATAGETVWVTNGTYVCTSPVLASSDGNTSTTMVFFSKSVKLRSVGGPSVTTLDAAGSASAPRHVVFFNTHPGTGAVLDGFTIKGGYVSNTAYPNWPHYYGGGVLIRSSSPIVTNCVMTGNYGGSGGSGLTCMFSGTITDCLISNNTGKAVRIRTGGTMRNCTVTHNINGGVHLQDSGPVVENCVVTSNGTYNAGDGGGVYMSNGGTVRNSLITYNLGRYGGGVCMYFAGANAPTVQNCTIAGNTGRVGGGYYTQSGAGTDGVVQNTIIKGNTFGSGGYAPEVLIGTSVPDVSFSCSPFDFSAYGTGNITNDPQYTSVATSDFRLWRSSPCIDQGTNAAWITGSTVDLDGNMRRYSGTVDMGAYEFIPRGTAVWVH